MKRKKSNKNQTKITIGILGFGHMGQAIFKLLKSQKQFKNSADFLIHDSKPAAGIKTAPDIESLLAKSDIVFLCVKPQDFYKLNRLENKTPSKTILISIMAGVKIANIKKIFPGFRTVRTMPNLALQAGEGVIGWHFDKNEINSTERKFLDQVFSLFGLSIYLPNEKMIDAITAISGSGPAYIFLFIDVLIKAAIKLGFSQSDAEKIVMQTVIGSTVYARSLGQPNFDQLIKTVQSPGGTTEAAFKTLNINAIYKEWQKATAEAYRRAQEISSYDLK